MLLPPQNFGNATAAISSTRVIVLLGLPSARQRITNRIIGGLRRTDVTACVMMSGSVCEPSDQRTRHGGKLSRAADRHRSEPSLSLAAGAMAADRNCFERDPNACRDSGASMPCSRILTASPSRITRTVSPSVMPTTRPVKSAWAVSASITEMKRAVKDRTANGTFTNILPVPNSRAFGLCSLLRASPGVSRPVNVRKG